jgi:hypothetical protein
MFPRDVKSTPKDPFFSLFSTPNSIQNMMLIRVPKIHPKMDHVQQEFLTPKQGETKANFAVWVSNPGLFLGAKHH